MSDEVIERARERSRTLRSEAARLEAEADGLDAAVAQIEEGARMLRAKLPRMRTTKSASAASEPTKTERIRDAVTSILSEGEGVPITTAALVRLLAEKFDIQVGGKEPVSNLSAKLSLAKGRFKLHGRQGWTLPVTETESLSLDNGEDPNTMEWRGNPANEGKGRDLETSDMT